MPVASWEAQRAELASVGAWIVSAYTARLAASGPDLALSVHTERERALLFMFPTTAQILRRVEALDAAVAAALDVPLPAAAPGSGPAADAEAAAASASAADKAADADAASVGGAADKDVEAAAGNDSAAVGAWPAVFGAQPRQAERKRRLKPYLANAAMLLAMCSSLASWLAIVKGCASGLKGLPAALSSRTAFVKGALVDWGRPGGPALQGCTDPRLSVPPPHEERSASLAASDADAATASSLPAALRSPANRFAFKHWFGMSVAMVGCTLFTWKASPGLQLGVQLRGGRHCGAR